MTQIYAAPAEFNGNEVAVIVADRKRTTHLYVNGTYFKSINDREDDEICKLYTLGPVFYGHAGMDLDASISEVETAGLNFDGALAIIKEHYKGLSKFVKKEIPFKVVVAGYDERHRSPLLASFAALEDELSSEISTCDKIVMASNPSPDTPLDYPYRTKDAEYSEADERRIAERIGSKKLELVVDALRELIRRDKNHGVLNISKNVDVGIAGPKTYFTPDGLRLFDFYREFPDSWTNRGAGNEKREMCNAAKLFFCEVRNAILLSNSVEEANMIYRVGHSGLVEVVRHFLGNDRLLNRIVPIGCPLSVKKELWGGEPVSGEILDSESIKERLEYVDKVVRGELF